MLLDLFLCESFDIVKMVKEVQDLDELKRCFTSANNKLVVVDFYADWCGPCVGIAPKIEEMDKAMDDVDFLKVNVDTAEEVAQEYKISAMPTFILFKNGEKVDNLTGANAEKLKEKIKAQK